MLPQTAANAAGRDIQLEVRGTGGTARIALPSGLALENSLGASVSAVGGLAQPRVQGGEVAAVHRAVPVHVAQGAGGVPGARTAGALSLILALSLLAGGLPAAYAADAGTPTGSIAAMTCWL